MIRIDLVDCLSLTSHKDARTDLGTTILFDVY